MKRAEERERLLRARNSNGLATSRAVVLRWRTLEHALHVDFLDPHSREPLARPRVWHDPATLRGLAQRALNPPTGGPARALFDRQLHAGDGEIELLVSAEQYARLTQ